MRVRARVRIRVRVRVRVRAKVRVRVGVEGRAVHPRPQVLERSVRVRAGV